MGASGQVKKHVFRMVTWLKKVWPDDERTKYRSDAEELKTLMME